jgi:histidine triad (HIT) family protein
VFHYHVHLIPRWDGDGVLGLWEPGRAEPQALQELAGQIRAAIG